MPIGDSGILRLLDAEELQQDFRRFSPRSVARPQFFQAPSRSLVPATRSNWAGTGSSSLQQAGSHGWQFRQFGSRIFMRFVAEVTESASPGTPRRFSSAAIPYGDIPARLEFTGPKISEWRYGVPRLLSFYAVTMVLN